MKKFIPFLGALLFSLTITAQYHSLLWKISGNGLRRPSYLFGTMHTADARAFGPAQKALKYFPKTKAYAMELDPQKMMDPGLLNKVMMGKGYSLKKMIPGAEYHFLDSLALIQTGYSMLLFDNVEPVFVMTILESVEMGLNDSSVDGNEDVMDLYFYNQAKKAKKKVIGIETVGEQLGALNSMSYDEQAKLLVDEIRTFNDKKDDDQDVLRFYIDQNLDSLGGPENDMPPKFYAAMITDRNARMADRIAVFIKKKPTFIAIGAMHLPGDGGVIDLLRKKGFKVEAVKL